MNGIKNPLSAMCKRKTAIEAKDSLKYCLSAWETPWRGSYKTISNVRNMDYTISSKSTGSQIRKKTYYNYYNDSRQDIIS